MIPSDARPRLAPKVMVRFDRKTDRYMLLYPEKGLALNPTAADIVQLCTGENTVGSILEQLAVKYPKQARADIEREMMGFLTVLADKGLVRYEA